MGMPALRLKKATVLTIVTTPSPLVGRLEDDATAFSAHRDFALREPALLGEADSLTATVLKQFCSSSLHGRSLDSCLDDVKIGPSTGHCGPTDHAPAPGIQHDSQVDGKAWWAVTSSNPWTGWSPSR